MSDALRTRHLSTLWVIGVALPVVLTVAVVLLRLDYVPSLLVTAVGFSAAGAYTGRQRWPGLVPVLVPLILPALAIYSLFALNAESWRLLGVPVAALSGCLAGLLAGRRLVSHEER